MGKIKEYFSNKGVGFYLSILTGVIALVTAIIYVVNYGNYASNDNKPVISWVAFVLLLVAFALPILASFFKLDKYAPYGASVLHLPHLLPRLRLIRGHRAPGQQEHVLLHQRIDGVRFRPHRRVLLRPANP